MTTKRQVIESFRNKLLERNADSNYTNQFLYNVLMEHAKWLIKREVSAGRVYSNNALFQTLHCVKVIETSTIEECCPVKTNCKIYRTEHKLPEMWIDNAGPVVRTITSVDATTMFIVTSPTIWQSKRTDPYQAMSKAMYAFFADGYFWFPDHNPHLVNINGYYVDDLTLLDVTCDDCEKTKDCIRFLDTEFMVPGWVHAEMFAKALEQIAGITKRLQEDEQIDKNPNRKN